MSVIIYVLCQGQSELALSLIKTSLPKDINAYEEGQTALHLAIQKNHLDIAKALLEKRANINALANDPAYRNMTPLHYAALTNNIAATRLLLAWGANTTLQNSYGHSAAMIAKQQGFFALEKLIEQQARYARSSASPISGSTNVIDFLLYKKKKQKKLIK